jgi:hypothetical protein
MPKAIETSSTRYNRAYYVANREREKARTAAYRAANPERHKAATAAWREANKERFLGMKVVWRKANAEHVKAYRKQQYELTRERENELARLYKKNNAARISALNCKRQAQRLKALPAWADLIAIETLYMEARTLTETTAVPHHVDHIVPLQSKRVCGLHCEANLRVITGKVNQSKSNRTWPDDIGE